MTLEEFRKHQAETKRAAILDAAHALFLEAGYAGASIAAIAERAGVSTATVYSHFDGKRGLFAAVVEHATEAMVLEGAADLRAVARAYARLMADNGLRGLLRLVAAEAPRFPELGEALFERGKARVYAAFGKALAAEAAAGRIAPRQDWSLAASQISGMISQSVLMPWLLANRDPMRDPMTAADEAVAVFLKE